MTLWRSSGWFINDFTTINLINWWLAMFYRLTDDILRVSRLSWYFCWKNGEMGNLQWLFGRSHFFDSLSCCSLCIYLINRPIINFLFLRLDHRRVIKWCEIRKPFFQTHIISTLQKSKFDIWRLVKAYGFLDQQGRPVVRSGRVTGSEGCGVTINSEK